MRQGTRIPDAHFRSFVAKVAVSAGYNSHFPKPKDPARRRYRIIFPPFHNPAILLADVLTKYAVHFFNRSLSILTSASSRFSFASSSSRSLRSCFAYDKDFAVHTIWLKEYQKNGKSIYIPGF